MQMTVQATIEALENELINEWYLNKKIGIVKCLIGLYEIRKTELAIEKYRKEKENVQKESNETE